MQVKEFINGGFKEFSNYDNVRSIPSIVDGLKVSQRKALHGMLEHGTKEIKVAQLAAYAGMVTHYAHGEMSMCSTIVGMAQNFAGSNNINLFEPIGQFGSILCADAASPRYIFTKPSDNLRKYIKKEDDCILEYLYEEGQKIEPRHYYPVLPLCVINGSVGIGTGFATKILNYNPKDVKRYIESKLAGKKPRKLTPYYEGFKGFVDKDENVTIFTGVIERVNTTTIKILELPIGYDIDKYKAILLTLIEKGIVKDYDNNSTDKGFEFILTVPRKTTQMSDGLLINTLKLTTRVTENYTLWDDMGDLVTYDSVEQIIDEFIEIRLELYSKRIATQICLLSADVAKMKERIRFIDLWNKDGGWLYKLKKDELRARLELEKFTDIDPLLRMPISALTLDERERLQEECEKVEGEIERLNNTTAQMAYESELKTV